MVTSEEVSMYFEKEERERIFEREKKKERERSLSQGNARPTWENTCNSPRIPVACPQNGGEPIFQVFQQSPKQFPKKQDESPIPVKKNASPVKKTGSPVKKAGSPVKKAGSRQKKVKTPKLLDLVIYFIEKHTQNLKMKRVAIGMTTFYTLGITFNCVLLPMLITLFAFSSAITAGILIYLTAALIMFLTRTVYVYLIYSHAGSNEMQIKANQTPTLMISLVVCCLCSYPCGPILWAIGCGATALTVFFSSPVFIYYLPQFSSIKLGSFLVALSGVFAAVTLTCPVWLLWWFSLYPFVFPLSLIFHHVLVPTYCRPSPEDLLLKFKNWRNKLEQDYNQERLTFKQ